MDRGFPCAFFVVCAAFARVPPFRKKQASSLDPEERAQRRQEKNQKRRERYLEILKRRQKHKEGQHKGKGKGEEEDDGSADGASAGTTAAGGMGGLSGGGGGGGGGPGGAGGDSAGIPMPVRYKDRAEERRKGKDEIYQQAAEELQEMKERSVEESKYLVSTNRNRSRLCLSHTQMYEKHRHSLRVFIYIYI